MKLPMLLAIDTSCDETSVAVTQGSVVLANVIASQVQLHKQYGGVFPTVAKQAHKENIEPTITAALKRAGIVKEHLGAVAVTQGPGLAPALEVGIEKAVQLAAELGTPLIPVNHMEGHLLSVLAQRPSREGGTQRQPKIEFPVLGIIVSGGHTEFVLVKNIGEYQRLGWTVDDAAGEALDKFGRMIDLGYPAGAIIEEFALKGDAHKYQFPLPMTTSGDFNMSFSGMKTAARNLVEKLQASQELKQQDIFDLCASFQFAIFRAITYKLGKLLEKNTVNEVWLGGGVASNSALRQAIRVVIKSHSLQLRVPYAKKLCVDNAAMIGVAAGFHLPNIEEIASQSIKLDRKPRWEIGE
jgi:N6-L-threonylcarbamoyladenine synthase